MKYNLFFLICFSFLVFACSKNDRKIETAPFLRIPENLKVLQYQQAARSVDLTIETNREDWTVHADQGWCTIERMSSNRQMLRLTLTENEGTKTRTVRLVFKVETITDSIIVQQLGIEPAILLNPPALDDVASTGVKIGFTVTTNLGKEDYGIIIPDTVQGWLHVEKVQKTKGMAAYPYTIRVDINPGVKSRTTAITVCGKGEEHKPAVILPVLQKGRPVDPEDIVVEGDIKIKPIGGNDNQHHRGQGIENTFDGKVGNGFTPFHSPWAIDRPTTVFPVTLEYLFDGKQDIDYLIYYPNGGNGNFGKFKLYTASVENETYVEAGEYDFRESPAVRKIVLPTALKKASRIKFEINSGAGGFASCSEMEFYRKNTDKALNQQLLTVFKDITCCELREGVTEEAIQALPGFFANLAVVLRENALTDWEKDFRMRD